MNSHRLLAKVLILSAVLLILHLLASEHAWYWHYWWFDIFMHFLGGFILGSFGVWFFLRMGRVIETRTVFYTVITGVFIIATGWEVFEYAHDLAGKGDYIVDTTIDLMLGVFGASSAYTLIRNKMNYGE